MSLIGRSKGSISPEPSGDSALDGREHPNPPAIPATTTSMPPSASVVRTSGHSPLSPLGKKIDASSLPPPNPQGARALSEKPKRPVPATDEEKTAIGIDVSVESPPAKQPSSEPPRSKLNAMALPALCAYGRFDILGRIAFGGMAEIFLGRESSQAGASRLLAIKRILPHVAGDPQFVEMFLDEARLAIQLNHPHICHIYEFGKLEDSFFIAMEWIHGAQLGKVIRKARSQGGLSPEIGARIIASVAEALHYAHRARDGTGEPMGIVHRDVSPHNVMVSYEGQVKLLDFGIAKAATHTTKTQAGVIKGKFSYMSPEQCMGKSVDARADVFALGICLHETLTGYPLYHRGTEYETMRAVVEQPAPSIRDRRPTLPIELDRIVQKALAKKRDDRFRSVGEMQSAIEDWLAGVGRAVTPARIGDLMQTLFEDQIVAGPLVDTTPFGSSFSRRDAETVPSTPTGSDISALPALASAPISTARPGTLDSDYDAENASSEGSVGLGQNAAGFLAAHRKGAVIATLFVAMALLSALIAVLTSNSSPRLPDSSIAPTSIIQTRRATAPPEPMDHQLEAAAEGHFRIALELEGAVVRIGDRTLSRDEIGRDISFAPGNYPVRIEHPSYRPWDGQVAIEAGATARIEPTLIPRDHTHSARPARISINTRPWSKVYVGSRLLGTTPIGEANVPSGRVRLRIVDRDGRTFSRSVQIAPGAQESVFFDLDEGRR